MTGAGVLKNLKYRTVSLLTFSAVLFSTILAPALHAQDSDSQKPVKDKWAVVIGISKFKDGKINLRYPSKDAEDFYRYLTEEAGFAKDHVLLLTDQEATRLRILSALGDKWLPRLANPDDLAVIYISSHGSPADIDVGGLNYIIAHDTNLDCLYGTAIPLQDLMRIVKSRVHCDRVVLILDACHSGAASAEASESKGLFRSGNVNASAMAEGTGQLVIASSRPDQVSWEGKNYQNSVFTYHLLKALKLKGNSTTLGEAFEEMKDSIQEEVLRDRGRLQTPEMKSQWRGESLALGLTPTKPRQGMEEVIPKPIPLSVSIAALTGKTPKPTSVPSPNPSPSPSQSQSPGQTSAQDSSIFDIMSMPAIPPVTVLDNGNIYKVFNGATKPTTFSISYPALLTYIYTYHWNDARGARPGKVALVHEDGTRYGPWQTTGKSGQGNVKNAYWECEPLAKLKPGTYRILDSDPKTWAQNVGSRGAGFARVRVAPLVQKVDSASGKQIKRTPSVKLYDNGNIYGVLNGPTKPTRFALKAPVLITRITNYHWNGGRGSRPGQISLVKNDGTVYGPWQANGRSGQAGAPEVYWDCDVDLILQPGVYQVRDSEPSTWSQNVQNNNRGITTIEGVIQN